MFLLFRQSEDIQFIPYGGNLLAGAPEIEKLELFLTISMLVLCLYYQTAVNQHFLSFGKCA